MGSGNLYFTRGRRIVLDVGTGYESFAEPYDIVLMSKEELKKGMPYLEVRKRLDECNIKQIERDAQIRNAEISAKIANALKEADKWTEVLKVLEHKACKNCGKEIVIWAVKDQAGNPLKEPFYIHKESEESGCILYAEPLNKNILKGAET